MVSSAFVPMLVSVTVDEGVFGRIACPPGAWLLIVMVNNGTAYSVTVIFDISFKLFLKHFQFPTFIQCVKYNQKLLIITVYDKFVLDSIFKMFWFLWNQP